jgi:hypothetical protein
MAADGEDTVSVEPFQQARQEPRCIICAAVIDAGARKCVRCSSFQDGAECVSCRLPIPAAAQVCTACKARQTGGRCRACGITIARGSKRCPQCSEWQTWRRFFSGLEVTFALLLAFFSVIGAVAPVVIGYLTNYSKTYVRVLGSRQYAEEGQPKEMTIAVLAVNNGKRMSFINSAHVTLIGDNAWSTPLRVRNVADQAVAPGKNVILYFTGSPKTKQGKSPAQSSASADDAAVRITVIIDESDRDGHVAPTSREQIVPAKILSDWIAEHEVKTHA